MRQAILEHGRWLNAQDRQLREIYHRFALKSLESAVFLYFKFDSFNLLSSFVCINLLLSTRIINGQ